MSYVSATSVQKTFKVETHTIFARATIGASGAATTITANGASKTATIAKVTGDGKYTITLDRGYTQFLGSPIVSFKVASGEPVAPIVFTVSENPSAGEITIQCLDETLTAANPASGEVLEVTLFATTSPAF